MPSVAPRRRSRTLFEDDEHEEIDQRSSDPVKRQRRHESLGNDYDEEDDGDDDDDPFAPTQRTFNGTPRQNGLLRGNSGNGYSPGAVLRVKLVNFVTYENAIFYPGPHLNMIIGPNGTGKSSLVCALALGLGYSTSVLGRASKFSEYVTHGKDSSIVEIELQRRSNEKENHVIRLEITRENDRRRWWLNGNDSSLKEVQRLVSRLRIACDNLCQFLPQEKVAEFAGLSPVQLLHETLRAAAPEEMIGWQSALKDHYKDFKVLKEKFDSDDEKLKNLENRQQGLQADVDRLNERETIKENIVSWKNARACAEYNTARTRYKEAHKKKKDAEKRLKQLEESCGPALQAVNAKEAYRAQIEAVLDHRKRALRTAELATDPALRAVESLDDQIRDCQSSIDREKASFQTKKNDIRTARLTLTKLEAERKGQPPPFNAAEWNHKIREQEFSLRDINSERREIDQHIIDIKSQGRQIGVEMKALKQSIENLDSQEGQKMSFLKHINPEVHQGLEWLQENQDKFDKEVFGPPMVTCSLKDERYSDLIQSMLQLNDFLCFTCQTRKDHKTLSEQFYTKMGLSVTIRTCGTDFQSLKSPVSTDEASRLGLDGFAIDYLAGPEPVLAMLCTERFLHSSGVALKEISSAQFESLQNSQKINTWATGQTYFRVIRRREYGPDATTTSTRKVNEGRFWNDRSVDSSEKTELEHRHREKKEQYDTLLKELADTQGQRQEKEEKEGTLNDEIVKLRQEKSELQAAHTKWVGLPDKIQSQKGNVQSKMDSLNACRARIAEAEAESEKHLLKKAEAVSRHKDLLSAIRDAHQALLDVQIRLIEAASDIRGLKERNAGITRGLEEKKEEIANFTANEHMFKEEANQARNRINRIIANGDTGDLQRYEEMVTGKTLEDIDNDISAEEAKLELIHAVDPSVLRQFERRAKEIEETEKEKEKMTAKLDRLSQQIKDLMNKFEPRIDELIAKVNQAFGHNFDMISCAGEVNINKAEDFEQWAIEIKVKFRENEELQLLNQHRQSGGERAVSTVFYIMALQSMAQAPFRVVDEINQGMDPRNERMVHERMVEIACREHTSQYFLITPKLLTGLRYDKRMRVLCITSGEHVPESAVDLNFTDLIQKQRALKATMVVA